MYVTFRVLFLWFILDQLNHLAGYEVLGQLLLEKAGMMLPDTFHAIFEFLGLDFKTPR